MTSKLPLNLEDLLRQRTVEGERIEYKAGWNPDPVVRTLCAFANDFENLGGGYIVIGQDCDAEGRPVFPPAGIALGELDKIQQALLQYCHAIEPRYFPVLSVEEFVGKTLLVLWAPAGMRRPYKAPKSVIAKHREYGYYIRRYASTIEAQGEDERDLLSLSGNVPFDDRFNREATVNDLSPRLMIEYLREVGSALAEGAAALSTEALGRQLNVVGGPPEAPMPKNVGLLFFNEAPQRFFPVTQIDVVYFPDGAGGDRFEEKEFRGPLARITRDAIDYIVRNYQKEIVLKHADRPEAERFWKGVGLKLIINGRTHQGMEQRYRVPRRWHGNTVRATASRARNAHSGPDRARSRSLARRRDASACPSASCAA